MLSVGTKAPEFSLLDQNGVLRTSDEFKGKKYIIYFYPKDNTPGCTSQACGYTESMPHFKEKGVEIIGVSKDSVASHKKFETNYNLSFTLLSDPDTVVIQAFDVWKEKKNYGKSYMGVLRTTYLVDENGIIIDACDKVKAKEDYKRMLGLL